MLLYVIIGIIVLAGFFFAFSPKGKLRKAVPVRKKKEKIVEKSAELLPEDRRETVPFTGDVFSFSTAEKDNDSNKRK